MTKHQLPNFLIIGAAKSGTTSLHEELSKHPEIFMCNPKEPHFLADLPNDTIGGNYGYPRVDEAGYQALFENVKEEKVIGESSVSTLFYKNAIKKAKTILGENIKIVVILRNPVDRAFSNYMMHVRDGFEDKTFEEALDLEEERKKENYWWGYFLKEAGLYGQQIANVFSAYDSSQVKVFLFEDLIKNRETTLNEICNFLEVATGFDFQKPIKSNTSGRPNPKSKSIRVFNSLFMGENIVKKIFRYILPKSVRQSIFDSAKKQLFDANLKKEKINPETKKSLITYFKSDIQELEKLINRDLSHWLK
jgi:hypothetical protein